MKADMRPRPHRSWIEDLIVWVLVLGTVAGLAWAVTHTYGL